MEEATEVKAEQWGGRKREKGGRKEEGDGGRERSEREGKKGGK